jgi:hypothetical protein
MTDIDITTELTPVDEDGELVSTILGRLFMEPDPVVRWNALIALRERRFAWVQEVTVAQMKEEGLSYQQIAGKLGITKGRAGQLGPDGGGEHGPAYAWGRALGAAEHLADLADRPYPGRGDRSNRNRTGCDRLLQTGLTTVSIRLRLTQEAHRWATKARANDALTRFSELIAESAELDGRLTVAQQGEATLGYHHERAERARRQDEARSANATKGS